MGCVGVWGLLCFVWVHHLCVMCGCLPMFVWFWFVCLVCPCLAWLGLFCPFGGDFGALVLIGGRRPGVSWGVPGEDGGALGCRHPYPGMGLGPFGALRGSEAVWRGQGACLLSSPARVSQAP